MTPSQELALYEFLHGLDGQLFEYGKNDCPLLAAGVLDCMDGGTRRAAMAGLWHDARTAWRYMKENGTISEHIRRNGWVEEKRGAAFAQIGDLLIMNRTLAHDRRWHSVAVCTGAKAAVMTEEVGLIRIPMTELPPVEEVLRWL